MNAKEMFEALGYEQIPFEISDEFIIYKNDNTGFGDNTHEIYFDRYERTYQSIGKSNWTNIKFNHNISLELHQAITQQLKELEPSKRSLIQ